MAKEENIRNGYWAIATQKHLKAFAVDSLHMDELDCLSIAGKAGRLLGTIRGNTQICNEEKIRKMANLSGIQPTELKNTILPYIIKASEGKVEAKIDDMGKIVDIHEYIFTNEDVMDITGKIFEQQYPSDVQRVCVDIMDETRKLPNYEHEIIDKMIKGGFKEQDIMKSLMVQESFKLISKVGKSKSNNSIISNEYVWGKNHDKIAKAVVDIDVDGKDSLREMIELVRNNQGYPLEELTQFDANLVNLAKKVGIINTTTIRTNRQIVKDFGFSPNMLEPLTYNDDILDDVKLFLASIRFGERYTQFSTIEDSVKFLKSLIKYGEIGPHSANQTDYTLLEKKGIVRVVNKTKTVWSRYYGGYCDKTGYCLELVKKDVAEEALKIIESPQYNVQFDKNIENFDLVNAKGDFLTPEENRIRLAEMPESMKEAEEELNKILRDENL